jgi:hypothetical protein
VQTELRAAARSERGKAWSCLYQLKAEQVRVESEALMEVPHGHDDAVEAGRRRLSWAS